MNKFIDNSIVYAVRQVVHKYPNAVFAGSFGLVLRWLLKRKVNDLDVLTDLEFSRHIASKERITDSSEIFTVAGKEVNVVPIEIRNVKVDLFCRNGYQEVVFFDNVLF